jgi:hypothetical protein
VAMNSLFKNNSALLHINARLFVVITKKGVLIAIRHLIFFIFYVCILLYLIDPSVKGNDFVLFIIVASLLALLDCPANPDE